MTQLQAMLCGLAAFFLWVLVDVAMKITSMGQGALSPFVIVAAVGLFGAVSLVFAQYLRRDIGALKPKNWHLQSWLGICAIIINYANVIALKHLPITMFYVVVFTIPLMIAVLSALFKHETLTLLKTACLLSGFGGTVLAIGIKGGGGDWIGYLAALISVTCFASYTILLRQIANTASAESTQLLMCLFLGFFGLAGALVEGASIPQPWFLIMMMAAGCLNTLGGIMYNVGIKNTVSTNVAQLHYTQIIFGAIFGYFLWNEIPTWNLFVGSIIIVVSGMIVAAQAKKADAAES